MCFNQYRKNWKTIHKNQIQECIEDEGKYSTAVYNERLCIKYSSIFIQKETKTKEIKNKKPKNQNAYTWLHITTIHATHLAPHQPHLYWASKIKLREMNKWTSAIRKVYEDYFVEKRIKIIYKKVSSRRLGLNARAHVPYLRKFMVETCKKLRMNEWKFAESNHKIHITSQFPHFAFAMEYYYLLVRFKSHIYFSHNTYSYVVESKLELPIKNCIRYDLTRRKLFFKNMKLKIRE